MPWRNRMFVSDGVDRSVRLNGFSPALRRTEETGWVSFGRLIATEVLLVLIPLRPVALGTQNLKVLQDILTATRSWNDVVNIQRLLVLGSSAQRTPPA